MRWKSSLRVEGEIKRRREVNMVGDEEQEEQEPAREDEKEKQCREQGCRLDEEDKEDHDEDDGRRKVNGSMHLEE